MGRKSEYIDHQRYMDDAAADAEHAGYEADARGAYDTEQAVIGKALRQLRGLIRVLFAGVVPVHERGHAEEETAVIEIEGFSCEAVGDIGAEEGSGKRCQSEGHGGMIEDAFLPYIGQCTGHGVREDNEYRGADDLSGGVEIRIDAAVRHEEDEKGDEDEAAADADEGSEGADSEAEQKKDDVFHREKVPFVC